MSSPAPPVSAPSDPSTTSDPVVGTARDAGPEPSLWRPAVALARRELVRFLRQRTRIIGALVQPVLFWVLFGVGLSGSFSMSGVEQGVGYQAYFLPGVAAMIVLFTAIFATISIIEDRDAGFLQGVLASSAPRLSVVLGKVGGGAILAFGQAALFLALAALLPLTGLFDDFSLAITAGRAIAIAAFLAAMSIALTALGFCIAWPSRSTQGYHAIMSVFLFPMWLLSGAFFPVEGAGWLRWIMYANPLTYGVAGLRRLMFPPETIAASTPPMAVCWIVTLVFAAVCVAIGVKQTRRV